MKYYVVNHNGGFKLTDYDTFIYYWDQFGDVTLNYDGNPIKKELVDLDNTFEVFNPHGILIAYKE